MDIKMTADDLLKFYGKYYSDGVTFKEIFGEKYDFQSLVERFSFNEIVMRIQEWRGTHRIK